MLAKLLTLALIALVALTGCDTNDPDAPRVTTEPVFAFADPSVAVGRSTLSRTDDALSMTFEAADYPEGTTFTVWWVVFNDPASCSDGACGEDDIFTDPVPPRTSVLFAAGGVVGADGRAAYTADLREGGPTGEVIVGPAGAHVLEDARSAEVHLVLRSHGPAIPDLVVEQTTTFGGGCLENRAAGEADPTVEGECGDLLFAVHRP